MMGITRTRRRRGKHDDDDVTILVAWMGRLPKKRPTRNEVVPSSYVLSTSLEHRRVNANDIHAAGNTTKRILGHGIYTPRPRPRPGLLIPRKVIRGKEAVERLANQALDIDRFPPPSSHLRVLNVIHIAANNSVAVLKGEPEELDKFMVRVGQHVPGTMLKVFALADVAFDAVLRTARVHDGEFVDGRQVLELLVHFVLGGLVKAGLEGVVAEFGRLGSQKRLPVVRFARLGSLPEKLVVALYACMVSDRQIWPCNMGRLSNPVRVFESTKGDFAQHVSSSMAYVPACRHERLLFLARQRPRRCSNGFPSCVPLSFLL